MPEAYCVKCKQKREIKDPMETIIPTRRGPKKFIQGTCSVCGTKVSVATK